MCGECGVRVGESASQRQRGQLAEGAQLVWCWASVKGKFNFGQWYKKQSSIALNWVLCLRLAAPKPTKVISMASNRKEKVVGSQTARTLWPDPKHPLLWGEKHTARKTTNPKTKQKPLLLCNVATAGYQNAPSNVTRCQEILL